MVLKFVRVRGGRVSGNTIVIFLFSIYNYDFLVFFLHALSFTSFYIIFICITCPDTNIVLFNRKMVYFSFSLLSNVVRSATDINNIIFYRRYMGNFHIVTYFLS